MSEVTYFISDGTYVKIGYTTDLELRLCQLQVGNARLLTVIRTIQGNVENELHEYFSEYHVRGEWFELRGELCTMVTETPVEKAVRVAASRLQISENEAWLRLEATDPPEERCILK